MTVTIPEIQMGWQAWAGLAAAAWYLAAGVWMRLSGKGRAIWKETDKNYQPPVCNAAVIAYWLGSPVALPFKALTWLLAGSEKKGTSV